MQAFFSFSSSYSVDTIEKLTWVIFGTLPIFLAAYNILVLPWFVEILPTLLIFSSQMLPIFLVNMGSRSLQPIF
jgi:hypothetical protein